MKGSCFCQAVRFELTGPTEFCGHCHCESCRKSHAAMLVTWTSVPEEQFRLVSGADQVKRFERTPGIGWEFCRRCGSSLFYRSTAAPGRVYVAACSLDDELDRRPDSHVSFEERLDWFDEVHLLPRYRAKSTETL